MNKIAITLFSLLLASITFAQTKTTDWSDWMGAKRDGVWNETGIIETIPKGGLKLVWKKPIGVGYTGPSTSGDKIFLMDWTVKPKTDEDKPAGGGAGDKKKSARPRLPGINGTERVVCLSAVDGKQIWEHSYECTYRVSYPFGPRTTPIVDGDHVYTLGTMGHLICFNKSDGKIVWQKVLTKEYNTKPPIWGYAAHPLIVGDKLFCTVGLEGNAIVCFNKKTGAEIWKSRSSSDIGYVPLVYYDPGSGKEKQLLSWHRDGVDSVNPETGKSNWFVKFPEKNQQAQATCIAMPRLIGNKLFVSEVFGGQLLLELSDDPTKVKEIYRSTPQQLRDQQALNSLMMTPLFKDGYIYGVGTSNRRLEAALKCVEIKTGKQMWSESKPLLNAAGDSKLQFANCFLIENNGRYFLANDQGELIIAELTKSGYKEIGRTKILEPTQKARGRTVVWSHPAFAGGKIFARNDKEIVCYDLRKSTYERKNN